MICTTSNDVINVKPNLGCYFLIFLFVSWPGRLIQGHSAQHRNTNLQCGSALSERGYVHIVAFAISDILIAIYISI